MPKFVVEVRYVSTRHFEVEADSFEDATEIVLQDNEDKLPLAYMDREPKIDWLDPIEGGYKKD